MLAGAGLASLSALPGIAGSSARDVDPGIGEYYERLRSRIGDAGGGRFMPAVEDDLMPEHNDFRTHQGLKPLRRHEGLVLAARAHAADLLQRRYFEHASPEGFTSVERVSLLARSFIGLAGENIVEEENGPPASAADLAELWRNSPGHRQNMLRPSYTHIGIGVVRGGSRTIGVRDAETELAKFSDAHQITNLDDQQGLLLRQQVELMQQQRDISARIGADGGQIEQVRRDLARTPRTVQLYTEQSRTAAADQGGKDLGSLQVRRDQMAANYQPGSAAMRDIDRQIANLRGGVGSGPARDVSSGRTGPNPLFDALTTQAASLEADRQGLRASLESLKATATQTRERLQELNDAGQQYRELKRNRDVLATTLEAFSRNSEEAQLNAVLERTREANVRVVQEAEPPPTGTSLRKLILLAGVVLGLAAAAATVMILSATRQVLIDPTDAERRMRLPVLAGVLERQRRGRSRAAPRAGRAELYRA